MWPPFGRHNSDSAWEVVDSKSIEPVSVYDDPDELPILRVASQNLTLSCTYDVRPPLPDDKVRSPISAALLNARGRLLREAARAEYNVFLVEGWSVTLQRKAHFSSSQADSHSHCAPYRLSVHYIGRPAFMRGAHPGTRPPPPFFSMLQDWGAQLEREYLSARPGDYHDDSARTGERAVSRSASKKSRASRVSPPLRSPSPRDVKRRMSMSRIGGARGWRKGVLRIIHLCW
ncbi:hypothetical protein FOMPIDRAFT_1046014 [Fomitopsis schrenkii]|uniref:Uncharacterized protein n=1 Tax=Fomitopsis schrenkii TaxID=2126942 RepID=S8FSE5_FOMSC|nr:hypothetical protein FOMPIDRAFT_1046014 [Fomitopsis schrenkii]